MKTLNFEQITRIRSGNITAQDRKELSDDKISAILYGPGYTKKNNVSGMSPREIIADLKDNNDFTREFFKTC